MFSVSPDLYEIFSLAMRYVFAFLGVLIMLRAFRWLLADRREQRARLRRLPDAGAVGELIVLRGSPELPENTCLPVPREGVLGFVRTCDLVVPCPGVRRNHLDFAWEDGLGLTLEPLPGCEFTVNDQQIGSRSGPRRTALGHGGILTVGEAVMRLHVFTGLQSAADAAYAAEPAPAPMQAYPEAVPFAQAQEQRDAFYMAQTPFGPDGGAEKPEPAGYVGNTAGPAAFEQAPDVPASDQAEPDADPSRFRRPRRSDRWKEDWSD